jgi:hypothetical protein
LTAPRIEHRKDIGGVCRFWHVHVGGMHQERGSLLAAQAAVAADQFLKGRHLLIGIQRADDDEITSMWKPCDTPQLLRA